MNDETNSDITISEDYAELEDTTVVIDDDSNEQNDVVYQQAMEYKELLDSAKEELTAKILAILEAGTITASDNEELDILSDSYIENYTALKKLAVEEGVSDNNETVKDNSVNADNLMDNIANGSDWYTLMKKDN